MTWWSACYMSGMGHAGDPEASINHGITETRYSLGYRLVSALEVFSMRIDRLFSLGLPTISFEFFPPKNEGGWAQLYQAIGELQPPDRGSPRGFVVTL